MVIHRRSHAALARVYWGTGSVRAFTLASCRRNGHLPPTSQARTTSFARPNRPVSSGNVLSFLRLAMVRAAPSSLAQRGRGKPSRPTGDTNVVSMASCAPWNNGSPSATTSSRRLSGRPWGRHQIQVTNQDISAHPGTCLPTNSGSGCLQGKTPTTQHSSLHKENKSIVVIYEFKSRIVNDICIVIVLKFHDTFDSRFFLVM